MAIGTYILSFREAIEQIVKDGQKRGFGPEMIAEAIETLVSCRKFEYYADDATYIAMTMTSNDHVAVNYGCLEPGEEFDFPDDIVYDSDLDRYLDDEAEYRELEYNWNPNAE